MEQKKHYVYMVRCADGAYYTGYTNNVENRIKAHNSGKGAKCLRGKRPVELVWFKGYRCGESARKEEYRIKQLRRDQKIKLILEAPNFALKSN
jgi:putative endonuclease